MATRFIKVPTAGKPIPSTPLDKDSANRDICPPSANEGKRPLTFADIKRAIPKHLFERSLLRSFGHLGLDLVESACCFAFVWLFVTFLPAGSVLRGVCWVAYWLYQGATWTGLWVLAHECGHGGFSDYSLVNDTVGLVLHSFLTVPYFAWAASHAKHHKNTNHMTLDEIYIPHHYNAKTDKDGPVTDSGLLKAAFNVFIMVTVGWYAYLAFHISGTEADSGVSHYDPNAPMFAKKGLYKKIVLSNIGLAVWFAVLGGLFYTYGFAWVFFLYVPPLMVTNFFLTSITLLQHTDLDVAHYSPEAFTWLRGALATIDRSLGPFLDYKTHYIASSHVVHHLISSMPFYNAQEATEYVAPVIGEYYAKADGGLWSFLRALYYNMRYCGDVEGESGILHFITDEH